MPILDIHFSNTFNVEQYYLQNIHHGIINIEIDRIDHEKFEHRVSIVFGTGNLDNCEDPFTDGNSDVSPLQ